MIVDVLTAKTQIWSSRSPHDKPGWGRTSSQQARQDSNHSLGWMSWRRKKMEKQKACHLPSCPESWGLSLPRPPVRCWCVLGQQCAKVPRLFCPSVCRLLCVQMYMGRLKITPCRARCSVHVFSISKQCNLHLQADQIRPVVIVIIQSGVFPPQST